MIVSSVIGSLRDATHFLSKAWRRHQAWLELSRLDSRGLHDLGLSSGDAWAAAEAYGDGHSYRCGSKFVEAAGVCSSSAS